MKKVSNKMLVVTVFNILWFTIVAIILQFVTSVELSSTLIGSWYTFWTVELFALMGIKVSKVKHLGNISDIVDDVVGDDSDEVEESEDDRG